ncbi:MAG: hypothetical protein ACK5Q5_20265 [Planctomycetaceae bacterium]
MRFLLETVRRILTAALVIGLLACAAEVALRVSRWRNSLANQSGVIPRQPSRVVGSELPAAWTGMGRDAESSQPISWRINSLSLRGPEVEIRKPAGSLRLIFLGDDQILADGLPEEATCPGQLASRLTARSSQPIEVINAGLPGGCPLTELIQYRRLLERLQPDLVLLHVDLNDAAEDLAARRTLRTDAAGWPVAVVHPTLDATPGLLAEVSERFELGAVLERRIGATLAEPKHRSLQDQFQQDLLAWSPREGETAIPTALEPIAQLKLLLDEQGTRLVVSTFPSAWQTAELLRARQPSGGSNELLDRPASVLTTACRSWRIDCVDVTPAVLQATDPARLYLPGGGSLSSAGQSLYADELVRALTSPSAVPAVSGQAGVTR